MTSDSTAIVQRLWNTFTVFRAYGWPETLTDEEILERLLALNLERAGKEAVAGVV
jgi:hypothetical protein